MLWTIILLLAFAVLIVGCFSTLKLRSLSKVSALQLSVNTDLSLECKLLIHKIERHFSKKVHVIVIQDDIKFENKRLYWPKKFIYAYISDIQLLANKYSYYLLENVHSSKLHQEIEYLIDYKVYIP